MTACSPWERQIMACQAEEVILAERCFYTKDQDRDGNRILYSKPFQPRITYMNLGGPLELARPYWQFQDLVPGYYQEPKIQWPFMSGKMTSGNFSKPLISIMHGSTVHKQKLWSGMIPYLYLVDWGGMQRRVPVCLLLPKTVPTFGLRPLLFSFHSVITIPTIHLFPWWMCRLRSAGTMFLSDFLPWQKDRCPVSARSLSIPNGQGNPGPAELSPPLQ